MLKLLFPFGLVRSINPITAIGIGTSGIGLLKSLFDGGGGGVDFDRLISQLRQTGGAAAKQNQAILGQSLAGGSRLQRQNVLGRQQNRDTEALFNAETEALRLLLGTQVQRDRVKFAKQQQLLSSLSLLGSSLGQLSQGGVKAGKTSGGAGGGAASLDFNTLMVLLKALQGGGDPDTGLGAQ